MHILADEALRDTLEPSCRVNADAHRLNCGRRAVANGGLFGRWEMNLSMEPA